MHLTPAQLAERLQVPLATVYKWNVEGTGPRFMKVGKHVRYPLAAVEEWEAGRLVEHGTPAA